MVWIYIWWVCVACFLITELCFIYARQAHTNYGWHKHGHTKLHIAWLFSFIYTRDNCSHKCISFCFFFLHFNHFAISINTFTAFLCLSESGVWLRSTSHQMTMFTTKLALETELLAFCLSMKVQEFFQRRMPTNLMDRIWPFRSIHIKSTFTSMSITPICLQWIFVDLDWTPFTLY